MWQYLKDLVPLAQTTLWVGLIVWVIRKYGSFIDQLLELFRKRVESGSSVKAGPFEIGQAVEPQSVLDQKIEADEEIKDFSESSTIYDALPHEAKSTIRSEYFLAEDLALRAIQEEYGESIKRNVKFLSYFQADGVFTKNGTLHVVEVKTLTHNNLKRIAKKTLTAMDNAIQNHRFKNIVIVFVVVIRESADTNLIPQFDDLSIDKYHTKIKLHVYPLKELKGTFGID
jgi:Holliday junction resolvase-like predicted endonuclease